MEKGFKEEFLSQLAKFPEEEKRIFDRIYRYWVTRGEIVPPKEMTSWIESTFGSLDAVKVQEFIRITNVVTFEGSIFNELRTRRPVVIDSKLGELLTEIEKSEGGPFEHPLTGTPADTFGRVKGEHSTTASNITKYDGLHGMVIFNEHNPLNFTREKIKDYFEVARKWFEKANKTNTEAKYPFFMWNCLWNAGASIVHGHAQMTLAEGQAYAKIEELRDLTLKYQELYKSNYFEDEYRIHKHLGLALRKGEIRVITKIAPIKEKDMMIIGPGFNDDLGNMVTDVLNILKNKFGVVSFNLSVILHPLSETPEVWNHMPIVIRILDRGSLASKTADMGSMEIFAQSVVGSNPYHVFRELKKEIGTDSK